MTLPPPPAWCQVWAVSRSRSCRRRQSRTRLVFPGAEQGTGSAHVLFPGALGPRVPDRAAAAAGLGKEIQEQADQTRRKEVTELPLLLLGEAPTH